MPFSARQGFFNQADTGPVAWTPDNLPGIQAWYDSTDSSSITLNGSNVSTWADQRGNYDWTQSTAGLQPLLTTGQSELSSSNVLKFDSDYMTADSMGTIFSTSQPGIMFLVLYNRSGSNGGTLSFNNHWVFNEEDADTDYLTLQRTNSPYLPRFTRDETPGGAPEFLTDSDTKQDEWMFMLGYTNTTTSRFRTNGGPGAGGRNGADETGGLPFTNENWTKVTLGAYYNHTATSYVGYSYSDIAAVVASNSAATVSDMEKLEGWAAHKYGLTVLLPTAHPYKTTAPTT